MTLPLCRYWTTRSQFSRSLTWEVFVALVASVLLVCCYDMSDCAATSLICVDAHSTRQLYRGAFVCACMPRMRLGCILLCCVFLPVLVDWFYTLASACLCLFLVFASLTLLIPLRLFVATMTAVPCSKLPTLQGCGTLFSLLQVGVYV